MRDRIIEQPLKIPFIAAVVLVLNSQKAEFTAEILKNVAHATQKHIEAGNWREVKLFLRFLGCIQGLFEGNGVFGLLEDFFSRAVDLQTASSEDVSYATSSEPPPTNNTIVTWTRTSEDYSLYRCLYHGIVCEWV